MFSDDHDSQSVGGVARCGAARAGGARSSEEEYHLVQFREKQREVHYFLVFIVHEEEGWEELLLLLPRRPARPKACPTALRRYRLLKRRR